MDFPCPVPARSALRSPGTELCARGAGRGSLGFPGSPRLGKTLPRPGLLWPVPAEKDAAPELASWRFPAWKSLGRELSSASVPLGMFSQLEETSSTSGPPLGVDALGTTTRQGRSASTPPRFTLKSLTRAFLLPSLIYPPAPGGQPGRRALPSARGKLLTTEILLCFPSRASRPRCHQRFPAVSEPSHQLGTRHLAAAGAESLGNDVGDQLPACATATSQPAQAELWERTGRGSACRDGSRWRLLGRGELRHRQGCPEQGRK